jgi:uncharacterized protein (TIGR02145 family)
MGILSFISALSIFLIYCYDQNNTTFESTRLAIPTGFESEVKTISSVNDKQFETVTIGNQTWSATNISIPVEGSMCYEHDAENCKKFGPLYSYQQALELETKFPGWRLPTKQDVDALISFLGGKTKAGKALKVGGSSGFNALMAGFKEARNGKFYRINEQTGFWTSTSAGEETAWKFYIAIEQDDINFHPVFKKYGDSVRLIKIE